ncbi:MAG: hypothetical protein QXI97_04460, partial [Nitrososphaerota archaeon]
KQIISPTAMEDYRQPRNFCLHGPTLVCMPWIGFVDEDKAEGEGAAAYEHLKMARDTVANIYKALSLNPDAMVRHLDLYMAVMRGSLPSGCERARSYNCEPLQRLRILCHVP